MDSFTAWDYIVAVVALASVVWGLFKGFIRSIFGIGAWVLGIMTPLVLIPLLLPGGLSSLQLPVPVWAANSIIFFIVFLVVHMIGSLLAGAVGKAGLSGTDRVFGALWGAGRAVLIIAVLVGIGAVLGATKNQAWNQAKSRPLLEHIYGLVEPLFPSKTASTKGTAGVITQQKVA